jgi:deoxyribodipyrimidine photo-lyase
MVHRSLFIFRRDLHIVDNIALIEACRQSQTVIPCFIFTPEQIESNPYRSDHCLTFMIEALEDLQEQLQGKLYFFYGEPEKICGRCIEELKIDAVFANRDYTPYSQKRDQKIQKVCQKKGAAFHLFDDALLHAPEETVKANGDPYTIFTPYFRHASGLIVPRPQGKPGERFFRGKIRFAKGKSLLDAIHPKGCKNLWPGSRAAACRILKKIGSFANYASSRDILSKETTHLSPYLKFNVVSIREVYHRVAGKLGQHHELIRSLYWRDFFTGIACFFPHVFEGAFHAKWDRLKWSYDKRAFQKWCDGMTGFPVVDAGMRELNATGFMHNRARMICASFLVKDLHLPWQWGEKYFAKKLIDYDPAVNNGNWQWAASTGCDAQPYFRIFNPMNQQKKFDPDCLYIEKWVPEWESALPILDHTRESQKALRMYRRVSSRREIVVEL